MLTLEVKRRIRLEGAELEHYYTLKREEQREAARIRFDTQRRSTRAQTIHDSDSDSSDNDVTIERMDGTKAARKSQINVRLLIHQMIY
jgi:hypothetical protein